MQLGIATLLAALACLASRATAQAVLSDADLRSRIVGHTYLLGDGRIIRFAPDGGYASINGHGHAGRGRWMIASKQICVDYVGATPRRCFSFWHSQDGLRVTDRDRTDQPAVPTSLDIASIGKARTLPACEQTITFSLTPPAPDVPANFRLFSGAWEGKWQSGLCGALAVQQILPDGTARLVVGWGSHVGMKPNYMGLLGRIAGNTLTAHGRDFTYDFTLADPTSLDAAFHSAGVTPGRLHKVK